MKTEIEKANKVLKQHLRDTDDICKVVDALNAKGRTF